MAFLLQQKDKFIEDLQSEVTKQREDLKIWTSSKKITSDVAVQSSVIIQTVHRSIQTQESSKNIAELESKLSQIQQMAIQKEKSLKELSGKLEDSLRVNSQNNSRYISLEIVL
jgi:hypothetical protein